MAIVRALIARIQGLFAWWIADIRRRPSIVGKVASLVIGLFVLCCACSFGLAVVRGTGQAIGIVATNTPRIPTTSPEPTVLSLARVVAEAPTIASESTAEVPPTFTPEPPTSTNSPISTQTPTIAAAPTALPTKPPATAIATPDPTATPVPVVPTPTVEPTAPPPSPEPTAPPAEPTQVPAAVPGEPRFTGEGQDQSVDPPYWPCQPGQIKGNRNSMKYHVPDGRYYAKTFKNVECFNSAAEAEAAGYVRAKNQ